MYVIYHSSDSFAEVTGVSIASLFENNKQFDEIHVLYIEKGMSVENKNKLNAIASQYSRTIEFMEMPNWSEKLNIQLKSCKSGWLGFGYNRLFLTEFVPNDVDRILYLDSDTIIDGSLDWLWNCNLDGFYMAGVDDCLSRTYRKIVGIKSDGIYCNSGMLLVNLKKWREDRITDAFIQMIYDNNGYFVFNEQSILNSLFSGKILILPQKYNVNSLVFLYSYSELIKLRKPHNYSYSEEELLDARKHPVITHFTGNFYIHRRPWIENSDHPYAKAYTRYRKLTPWRNLPLQQDRRSKKAIVYTTICKKLPRSMMIFMVSIIYNYIRPISFYSQIKKMRG